ncbi:MAG TPA: polysaccharide export protein [Arcobacter sp.]|nr:polysaccharide export protein [Arcobacter sp.]
MKNYLLGILIIIFTGCSTKDDFIPLHKAQANQQELITNLEHVEFEYKILPHDRISIIVYNHPELSSNNVHSVQEERGLLVNSKGYLRLPLVKKIHIAGLTQTEAEEKISNAFSTFLKQPDIHIEVINKRAYVIGEVNRPGEVKLINERLSLLRLIAVAGDLTASADKSSILILKGNNLSKAQSRIVNLTDANALLTANLMIEPNDIVYVMPNDMKAFNTTVGEVSPVFQVISSILQPFVSIKFLRR